MRSPTEVLIVVLFLTCSLVLAVYGLHLYVLLYLFHRRRGTKGVDQRAFIDRYLAETSESDWLSTLAPVPRQGPQRSPSAWPARRLGCSALPTAPRGLAATS